jgi:perosamine synthetase
MKVPFFRVDLDETEIAEVAAALRSGWLTTGPRAARFERDFAAAVGARHALAVNSATAALHLAVEALGLGPGQAVLVPTMTFAATAEVVRYRGAVPLLVDCDPVTLHLDLADAEAKLAALAAGELPLPPDLAVVGALPVHVGGLMLDVGALAEFAARHRLWLVEDAAHAFPAAWRAGGGDPWRRCGEATAAVSCFSFYANKTITTGEGGMAVTASDELAERMRVMSLHGLSTEAWGRYTAAGSWDYRIVAPGFKYNLTDVAAALGIHQLARAESLRLARQAVVRRYFEAFADLEAVELPPDPPDRVHAWHLFPLRLRPDLLGCDRDGFIERLRAAGVGSSVHWRPLHLHPYYRDAFGWLPRHLPAASAVWERLVSLPLYPTMSDEEQAHVIATVREICRRDARP